MLNNVVLVGRLVRNPELRDTDQGKKMTYITLAVPRGYKNMNGEYDTDFIDCILWDVVATNTAEYCKKGDIIGIRGRLQSRVITQENEKKYLTDLIAEKVSFLTSREAKMKTE